MSQLPRVAYATLADAKITQYLLNSAHSDGAAKATFFRSFGFSSAHWSELKKALLDHPLQNLVTNQTSNPFWSKVRGQLLAGDAGRAESLHHLGPDYRAARPQPEVYHRLPEPVSRRVGEPRFLGGLRCAYPPYDSLVAAVRSARRRGRRRRPSGRGCRGARARSSPAR
jgi:hypothetical protein